MGANAVVADTVGHVTFTGTAGPVGQDGQPVVFYHGTKDDVTSFDLMPPSRAKKRLFKPLPLASQRRA